MYMATRREFPALRRRRHYLEQEVYTYDKYLRSATDQDPASQNKAAIDAERNSEELDELDYVLRFMERLTNGYHLSRPQWLLLIISITLAIALAVGAVIL
jgi:hypothetical protein